MKIGYADPPYIGCAHLYADHPDFAGEVDHAALIHRRKGGSLEYRALYPNNVQCPDCGQWMRPGNPCDHIPF